MDDNLNKPQWTIRQIPWITIIAPIVMAYAVYWLIIVRKSSLTVSAFFLLFIFLIIPFIEITICTFDSYMNKATIVRQRIWRRRTDEFHFNDLHTVAVQESNTGDDGSPMYRIAFFMHDAKLIPLTTQHDSGKRRKDKLAEKIGAYIQVHRGYAVNLAPDGNVRIQQPLHPSQNNWMVSNIFRNNSSPLTSFEIAYPSSISGFMLIVPAGLSSTTRIPGGLGGKIINKFYGAYFRAMDVSIQEVADLENSTVLKGPEIGLSKRFAVVTNQPDWAQRWLQGKPSQALNHWQKTNPLKGKPAVVEPHIFINYNGIKVVFRENYNQSPKITTIIQFVNQLI